jgi:hypothetical protein
MSAATVGTYFDERGALLQGRPGSYGIRNRRRSELYFLAEFYAWSARRASAPCGNNPLNGLAWPKAGPDGQLARALAKAESIALARVCFKLARAMPNPLEVTPI